MSGGEPSSIKRKPSCAADLPILSPNRRKAAGSTLSNRSRAVLWGADQISLETTLSSEWDVPGDARIHPNGTKVPTSETFAPTGIKSPAEPDFLSNGARSAQENAGRRACARLFYGITGRRGVGACIRHYTASGGRRPLRT